MIERIVCRNPNIRLGTRLIEESDSEALLPLEIMSLGKVASKVRSQSGAARIVARELLQEFGWANISLQKSSGGCPIWPRGITGSLAHHDVVAAAAVAQAPCVTALGIDIEPNEPLPDELIDMIATGYERKLYDRYFLSTRKLFVIKEAVYKAYYCINPRFVEFHEIEIELESRIGRVKGFNREINIDLILKNDVIGVAYI